MSGTPFGLVRQLSTFFYNIHIVFLRIRKLVNLRGIRLSFQLLHEKDP